MDAGADDAPAAGGRGAGGSMTPGIGGAGGNGAGGNGAGGAGGAHVAVANFLDRIDFGDRGTGATSESAHSLVQPAATTGTGMFGQTYRVIAASAATPGDPSTNAVLTFTLACDPTLQNYLTVKLWGGDSPGRDHLPLRSGARLPSRPTTTARASPRSTFRKTPRRWRPAASST